LAQDIATVIARTSNITSGNLLAFPIYTKINGTTKKHSSHCLQEPSNHIKTSKLVFAADATLELDAVQPREQVTSRKTSVYHQRKLHGNSVKNLNGKIRKLQT